MELEPCPGCHVRLAPIDGPTHRYIGASPACWDVYTRLGAGDPPVGGGPGAPLVVDAYAAQHPGEASPQATQSVAVHLAVLHGVSVHGEPLNDLVRLRTDVVEVGRRQGGYPRLLPAPREWDVTVHDVVAAPDPASQANVSARWAHAVLAGWSAVHAATIEGWYRAARPS